MDIETSALVELRRSSSAGIFAVTYSRGRRRKMLRLLDGAIVEATTPDQRRDAPDHPESVIGVAIDGTPATIHHANLGLIAEYVVLEGVYVLSDGDVAAVYGAEAIAIG